MDSLFDRIFYGTAFGGRSRMSAARAGYLFVAWVLVPGIMVISFYQLLVGLVFQSALTGMGDRINADITFRHPFITWRGDIGLEDLRLRQRDSESPVQLSLDVKRVLIDLPNLGVLQEAAAVSGGDDGGETQNRLLGVVNHLDHIGLHLEGLQYDGPSAMPGLLNYIGRASAAPLETEGCVGDILWVSSALEKMGISNQGADLHLTLANAPDEHEVHVLGEIVSPHSSHAQFEQHFPAPSMASFLEADTHTASFERIAIADEGFVAARDAFCAKRDGVSPEEFRERHIASVNRLLEQNGMRPSPEVESVYRQYLLHGKLVLEARPNTRVSREDYHHYSVADQAKMFNATLSAGDRPVPVGFVEIPSRAIPLTFEGSTWDLVAAESRASSEAAPDGTVATNGVAATPAPVAAPATTSPTNAAPPPVAPTAAMAQATSVTSISPAKPAPKVEMAPDWAIPHQTTRTTVDGRPLASSLPGKVAQQRRFQPLAFEELPQHLGDRVLVTTIYGDRHEGKVEEVVGSTLRLRSTPAMGYAIVNFERAKLRSITSLE